MAEPANPPLVEFLEKLQTHASLEGADADAVLTLPYAVKSLRRHEFIVREYDSPQHCCVLLSGFAMRHKTAGNGARQIFSIHMRGDPIDLHSALFDRSDHNIEMLSPGDVAFIPVEAIRELTLSNPLVAQAMWRETLVDAAIFREWTLNVGKRDARSRMAHMLCEFALRLEMAGLSGATDYELPMTQEELGDALALTSIHISRTLKGLAAEGLVARTRRSVKILDWHALAKLGDFEPGYLHPARNT